MTAEPGERASNGSVVSGARKAAGVRLVAMALVGILAGYSISVLGKDVVILPVVGSVSGSLLGAAGLLVAAIAYHRTDCCEDCDRKTFGFGSDCGCSDDCGDSCSYEP